MLSRGALGHTSVATLTCPRSWTFCVQRRGIAADKVRAGHIVRYDKNFWRVGSAKRSQKGKNAAVIGLTLDGLGTKGGISCYGNTKTKVVSVSCGVEFEEANYTRLKVLFSGFDENDMACFVFPIDSMDHGKEINIPGTALLEQHQNFLCVRMPCDLLRVIDDRAGADADAGKENYIYPEMTLPNNYVYTVDKITTRNGYKFATFVECDGSVTVTDSIQPGMQVKVILRSDGTGGSFGGRAQ
ncbi:trans-sialidase [Perkinsela sp. CCAP 1560/4]|nr:trans-sialidase [Perkinsela sp. CCAP 1560/4]|eukprot:KNH05467.1 trans-sialidase [Perkinsela sp. CCAP 1560/4]